MSDERPVEEMTDGEISEELRLLREERLRNEAEHGSIPERLRRMGFWTEEERKAAGYQWLTSVVLRTGSRYQVTP